MAVTALERVCVASWHSTQFINLRYNSNRNLIACPPPDEISDLKQ